MTSTELKTNQYADKSVTKAKIEDLAANKLLGAISAGTAVEIDLTSAGRALIDDADATAQRATLGLQNMATQDASAVAITGGAITGTTIDGVSIKSYVDQAIQGIKWKNSVKAATTANGTLATAFANGQVIDGVTLAAGDRILLKNQTTGADNGIYDVPVSGAPTRSLDANAALELEGASVFVQQGTVNANQAFTQTADGIALNTTSLVWVLFSSITAPTFVTWEAVTGTKDGSNATFTLANTPVAGSVALYHNGMRLDSGAGNDYTISGLTLTMLTKHIPLAADKLFADYRY